MVRYTKEDGDHHLTIGSYISGRRVIINRIECTCQANAFLTMDSSHKKLIRFILKYIKEAKGWVRKSENIYC